MEKIAANNKACVSAQLTVLGWREKLQESVSRAQNIPVIFQVCFGWCGFLPFSPVFRVLQRGSVPAGYSVGLISPPAQSSIAAGGCA